MRYHWASPALLFDLLVEFTDIIMLRKCMLGIKQRAERASKPNETNAVRRCYSLRNIGHLFQQLTLDAVPPCNSAML